MDPDPGSGYKIAKLQNFATNTLKNNTQNLQFYEEDGYKSFHTACLLDSTENLVISSSLFDSNYKLLNGNITIIELNSSEYCSILRNIGDENDLFLIGEQLKHRQSINLYTYQDEASPSIYHKKITEEANGQIAPMNLTLALFYELAIDNRQLFSLIDRMNNYLIYCGSVRDLPREAFKEFEDFVKENDKQNEKAEPATVYKFGSLKKAKTTQKSA